MNTSNPVPLVPPIIPNPPPVADPEERAPLKGVMAVAEAILRQPRRVLFWLRQQGPGPLIGALLAIAVTCALVYGLVVGAFSGGTQYWAAPAKIVIGLLITALICLPSLYIFSCLSGSRARLVEVFGLVAGLLALTAVLLIGFAPVAWVFSQSTQSACIMGTLHICFWLVATYFGLRFLRHGFNLVNSGSGGGAGLKFWVVIFLLVGMQMTTALRPLLGKSEQFLPAAADKKFFLGYWMDCFQNDQQKSKAKQRTRSLNEARSLTQASNESTFHNMTDCKSTSRTPVAIPLVALFVASAVAVALTAVRIERTRSLGYLCLAWNLFLAWLPLIFALAVHRRHRRGERRGWRFYLQAFLWLLFLPNAPYIFTDLIHLTTRFFPHFWVDMTLILIVAFIGFLLGFISLYLMQTIVAERHGRIAGWLFVLAASGLSSCGIYFGRFLRWNSWDVLTHPVAISEYLGRLASHTLARPHSLVFVGFFATILFHGYLMLYALTHLQPVSPRQTIAV